jgi:Asp-tRNA(Asn)/Glu-tRNA(Gln) amidotransferase B subunit
MFGRGLVEPVNDLRPTNPATHPRLLERLAEQFAANHFEIRWLVKTIAASRAYQLTAQTTAFNEADDRFYSHALLKPLSAHTLVDAISQVTGVEEVFASAPEGTHATQLIGAQTPSYALDVLGRCRRERACQPAASGGGLAQALHLINGSTINAKLSKGALADLFKAGKSNSEIIEEFYVRALSRTPRKSELKFWEQALSRIPNRAQALEDFVWTLLNCREFAYNH